MVDRTQGGDVTEQAIAALQQNLRGRLIQPTDADYDAARALYNGMIDKRPRLIARCVDTADVITAVNVGREQNILAIRGGGGNFGVVTSFLFRAHAVKTVYAVRSSGMRFMPGR
jgi:hypothetical protein